VSPFAEQDGAKVLTAYFHPAEGRYDDAVAAINSAIKGIHDEPGCLLYAMHQPAERDHILVLEKWESQAALDAHSSGSAIQHLRSALSGLLAKGTDVTVYSPVPAGNEQGEL
jgi:quinol monooxygenase YgiN